MLPLPVLQLNARMHQLFSTTSQSNNGSTETISEFDRLRLNCDQESCTQLFHEVTSGLNCQTENGMIILIYVLLSTPHSSNTHTCIYNFTKYSFIKLKNYYKFL